MASSPHIATSGDAWSAPDAARAGTLCTHCGLPVPAGLIEAGATHQFCCSGCRTVHAVIASAGLENYYRLRARDEAAPRAAAHSGRRYEEFDDAVFERLYVRTLPDGCKSVELFLEGVHCNACVWLVERLPLVAPHVREARLDVRRALVRLVWDPARGSLSQASRALDSLGYPPHPARDAAARDLRRIEDRKLLVRIAVAGACAGNVMLFAFALYGGAFAGMETAFERFFRWGSAVLGLLSLAWPGSLFFRGAWAALRTRTAHLDLPIAIGLAAGGVAGAINTILDRGEIYFDSLTVLVFLLLVGRWIQRRQQRWATDAVELLFSLTPTAARRITGGAIQTVPIEAIAAGDLIEVRAGETVPVDGKVTLGTSALDEALLTGESLPRDVCVGARVCAGTINVAAPLRVRVEATGAGSRVGKLMELVERSAREPGRIVKMADRIAGHFTVAMLLLAAVTLGAWLWIDPAHALDHATALLIVTCPCALGLATPLTVTVAIGRAARRGILIKGGETLERLARPGTILLDKTGTLTQGRMALLEWWGDESLKSDAAAVERHSAHPIARAFVEAHGEPGARDEVADVSQSPGGGIAARVGARRIALGSVGFVRGRGIDLPAEAADAAERFSSRALTPVLIAADGAVAAVAGLGDPLRPDAADSVRALRARGWKVEILSGDHPQAVAAVGAALGIDAADCRGHVAPEEKLAVVRDKLQRGPVIMVGDGVNDAAALAAATVGIAVHGGAEASLSAAGIYLDRPGLAPIVEVLEGGQRTFRVIRRGLAASVFYNAVAGTLALTGVINPIIAAILMPLSSLTVLSNAFGGRTFLQTGERA